MFFQYCWLLPNMTMVETVISNEINCVGLTIINPLNEACQPWDLSQIKPPFVYVTNYTLDQVSDL